MILLYVRNLKISNPNLNLLYLLYFKATFGIFQFTHLIKIKKWSSRKSYKKKIRVHLIYRLIKNTNPNNIPAYIIAQHQNKNINQTQTLVTKTQRSDTTGHNTTLNFSNDPRDPAARDLARTKKHTTPFDQLTARQTTAIPRDTPSAVCRSFP